MPHVWAHKNQDNKPSTLESAPLTEEAKQAVPTNRLDILPIEWPDYGSLLIDWGFNFLRDCPKEMKDKAFNARSLNLSAYYNIRLGKSHFVISPGIGVGFEGYQFQEAKGEYWTAVRKESDRKHTAFKQVKDLLPKSEKVIKSELGVRYWDALLEVRFNSDKKYPKEGFFAAIGFNIGVPQVASTTIKHQEEGEPEKNVHYASYNLNKMRYGAQARLGWGRFSIFYARTFSNLFNEEKGPNETTTKPAKFGLSIDLF